MNEVEQNKPNAFRRHPILTGVLLLMLAWSWFYPGWRQEMTRRPLDVPISISPPGEIRETIHIPLAETYELLIGFDRGGRDGTQWRELLGEGHSSSPKKGIPIMIRWEIYEKTKHSLIKSGEERTLNTTAWKRDYVYRLISYVKEPPGDYEIAVKLLQEMPEITNPRAKIVMQLVSGIDAPSTSERKLIQWIGILMIEPLIWIIEAMLTLVLLYKVLRNR